MIYVHGELKRRNSFVREDFYYLKEYFQLYRNIEDIKEIRVKRYISNLDKIVDNYEKLLDKSFKENGKLILHELIRIQNAKSNFFEKCINFKDDNYYWLYFDVKKLNDIAKEMKLSIHRVNISDINFDSDGLTDKNVKKSQENTTPIIIGNLEQVGLLTVLDGNHRSTFKQRNNKKHIDPYILNHKELSQCFVSEFFRNIFYMHRNLYYMMLYMVGNISKFKMLKEIIPIITHEKHSFKDYLTCSIRNY